MLSQGEPAVQSQYVQYLPVGGTTLVGLGGGPLGWAGLDHGRTLQRASTETHRLRFLSWICTLPIFIEYQIITAAIFGDHGRRRGPSFAWTTYASASMTAASLPNPARTSGHGGGDVPIQMSPFHFFRREADG